MSGCNESEALYELANQMEVDKPLKWQVTGEGGRSADVEFQVYKSQTGVLWHCSLRVDLKRYSSGICPLNVGRTGWRDPDQPPPATSVSTFLRPKVVEEGSTSGLEMDQGDGEQVRWIYSSFGGGSDRPGIAPELKSILDTLTVPMILEGVKSVIGETHELVADCCEGC